MDKNCGCFPVDDNVIKFVNEDNLYYFTELVKSFTDKRIEAAIKEAVTTEGITADDLIKKINAMLADGSLMSGDDIKAAIATAKKAATDDAVAQVNTNLGSAIDSAIASKVPAAVESAVKEAGALTETAAKAEFVLKAGDTMTGALTAPKFVTASGIEFY